MRTIYVLMAVLACGVVLLGASPVDASMQGDVDQAATIIERFQAVPEKGIPQAVLKDARGLAIMTVIKAAFGISGRGGTGIVVARTGKGWSGPSAIGTGGAGFGFQIGAEVTEFVMILNTDAAVQAFSHDVNVTLGGDISVAAGPIGRTASVAVTPVAAIYTYSRSQGLFAGVSLEGTVIGTRNDANAEYYGRPVTPEEIVSGKVPRRVGPCDWSRYSHARRSPNAKATPAREAT
ncbi:MAG TPA: YSC84-related protein [Candidatus Saccharimonadia bacterium]|nr:YSC84-related protein [Candidatus Saccharimonadia bacterium]